MNNLLIFYRHICIFSPIQSLISVILTGVPPHQILVNLNFLKLNFWRAIRRYIKPFVVIRPIDLESQAIPFLRSMGIDFNTYVSQLSLIALSVNVNKILQIILVIVRATPNQKFSVWLLFWATPIILIQQPLVFQRQLKCVLSNDALWGLEFESPEIIAIHFVWPPEAFLVLANIYNLEEF